MVHLETLAATVPSVLALMATSKSWGQEDTSSGQPLAVVWAQGVSPWVTSCCERSTCHAWSGNSGKSS